MFKVFMFVQRSADLQALRYEAYRDYYEANAVPAERRLIEQRRLSPYIDHRRNYVRRDAEPDTTAGIGLQCALVTEATFKDRASYEGVLGTGPTWRGNRRDMLVDERVGGIPMADTSAGPHFKVLMFARRRPDLARLSHEEYVDFYETKRVPLARRLVEEGVLPPYVDQRRNYVRRTEPINVQLVPALDFDIVLEATYQDRATYEMIGRATQGVAKKALYEDSSQPFDLQSRSYLYVEERTGGVPLID